GAPLPEGPAELAAARQHQAGRVDSESLLGADARGLPAQQRVSILQRPQQPPDRPPEYGIVAIPVPAQQVHAQIAAVFLLDSRQLVPAVAAVVDRPDPRFRLPAGYPRGQDGHPLVPPAAVPILASASIRQA